MGSSKSCIQPAAPEGASEPLPADGGGATLRTPSSPSHDCGSGAHEAEGRAAQRGVAQPSSAGVADAAARFSCPLFEGIDPGTYFYFTHSYIAPDGPFVVGQTTHSVTFPSAVQYGDACFGVQFHPEKSSDAGAALLRNFVRIVKEGGR